MGQDLEIKQTILYKNLKIQLLDVQAPDLQTSIANIVAYDSGEKIVWRVEPPVTYYEFYYNMELDFSRNVLVANTGSGYRHIIDLNNGKIIDAFLVK